ncbi:MAG TPA: hypothetical protein VG271_14295, partial [Beijerinckiaceae bacterium]|nr:hypothetical protein [Beijerinckiaceae bacterium]
RPRKSDLSDLRSVKPKSATADFDDAAFGGSSDEDGVSKQSLTGHFHRSRAEQNAVQKAWSRIIVREAYEAL